jgi:hypothetical protein
MKIKHIAPIIIGCSLITTNMAQAEGAIESLTGSNINDAKILKDLGIEIGGWAAAGITYASHNGDHNSNAPISFNDRINEVMLNQLNLYVEKAVVTNGNDWSIGGRVDFMFGTDAKRTQAAGLDNQILGSTNNKSFNQYDVAFPQAYAEIYAPIGNGLTAKVGHFYTNIGYEVVTAPDNFFYSHAYTMLYAEPFTHSGALLTYQVNDNISVSGGAVTGWDNFDNNGGDWSFLGGASWASDDQKTALAVSLITGENGDDSVGQNSTMYSVVLSHDISDNLHYVFQHDFGTTEGLAAADDTDWYGINQYLTYDINDKLATGLRFEWFSDRDNRVSDFNANYYAISAGVNYSPVSWLKFRTEVRYDWADTNGAGSAFDNGNENDQVAVSMDMIFTF